MDAIAALDEVERLIDVGEVARRLDVAPATVYSMVRAKTFFPPMEVGRLRKWRSGDVTEWIVARRTEAAKIAAAAKEATKPRKRRGA